MKPKLEDVLFLSKGCEHSVKHNNQVFISKKEYDMDDNICPTVMLNQENLAHLIKEELKGKYYPGFVKYFKVNSDDCIHKASKNSQKSVEARIKGNELLAKKEHNTDIHEKIWKLYSKSIAFAPIGSKELVLAYECRSNLLLHLKKYEDCIKDIDRALSFTEFDLLKVKLLCRKMTCLVAMNKDVFAKVVLWETVKCHLKKIDSVFKDEKFSKMVEQAESVVSIQPDKNVKDEKDSCTSVTSFVNVTLTLNKEKHIIADKNYEAGEIVIVSNPSVATVNPDKFYAHCSHCLSFMWAGIPCDECSLCMYCSEECKKVAWEKYHILECKINPHIDFNHSIYYVLANTVKIFIMGVREFGSISKLVEKVREVEEVEGNTNLTDEWFDNTFLAFYSLPNIPYTDFCNLSNYVKNACFLMAYLTQIVSDIFENNVESMKGKKLSRDQDFVSSTVIMLKLMILCDISQYYPHIRLSSKCPKYESTEECFLNRCCPVGSTLKYYTRFMEKSCNPNLSVCQTQDGKAIYYCTQPIKKMEKLTVTSTVPFYQFDRYDRHLLQPNILNVTHVCICICCLKEWPPILQDCRKFETKFLRRLSKVQTKGAAIVAKYLHRYLTVQQNHQRYFSFNLEEFQELARDTNVVVNTCGHPSFASCWMMFTLYRAFRKLYGGLPDIPNDC